MIANKLGGGLHCNLHVLSLFLSRIFIFFYENRETIEFVGEWIFLHSMELKLFIHTLLELFGKNNCLCSLHPQLLLLLCVVHVGKEKIHSG